MMDENNDRNLNNEPKPENNEHPQASQNYGEYAYKRPESAQQTSYQPPYQSYHAPRYEQTYEPPRYQYQSYNPYAAQRDTEKEMRSFKKKMYGLLAGFCALALVVGVVGGGLGGYFMANRGNTVQTTVAAPSDNQSMFENPPATTQAPQTSAIQAPQRGEYDAPSYLTVPADTEAKPVQQIYAENVDSVVSIYVETTVTNNGYYYYGQEQSYTQKGAGSGVIITNDGFIATNNHVIEGADKIRVALQDGREFEAVLVGTDSETDVALIKIEADDLKAAAVGDSDTLAVGDQAIVIGNPLGRLSGTLTVGYVSALNRELLMDSRTGQTMNVIQTDAAVNPGNSGGALFNAKGELVGIIFAKTSDTDVEGLGYAIPINKAVKIIDDLVEHGYVTGRPALGIQVITISDQMTAMMYRVNYLGVYVSTSTNPENGLQSGDLIVSVNGAEIGDYASLATAIKAMSVGDTATVEVMRNGEKITLNVPVIENVPAMLQGN